MISVLRYFDVSRPATIQCDAPKEIISTKLLQNNQPIDYVMRSLKKMRYDYEKISNSGHSDITNDLLGIFTVHDFGLQESFINSLKKIIHNVSSPN